MEIGVISAVIEVIEEGMEIEQWLYAGREFTTDVRSEGGTGDFSVNDEGTATPLKEQMKGRPCWEK